MTKSRFIARTVLVTSNDVDAAYRSLNRILNNERLFEIARRWQYYEKPCKKRNRLCFEKAYQIYNNDMERKINLIMKTNRMTPWPWQ
ncbi:hypothetical protein GJ496_010852 [Pomphorhynchus laevis]|nr:hypothetical protein GJ496_010846 [Pomphorhynchus laevis]KAI0979107.1 hypothetical protein GJ496_010852 [Pomphorhynchus laevis]